MPKFIIKVSDKELKALEWDIYDVQEWIQNAVSEKARRVIDTLINQHTKFNPKKLSRTERDEEIRKINLKSARERNEEFENSIFDQS